MLGGSPQYQNKREPNKKRSHAVQQAVSIQDPPCGPALSSVFKAIGDPGTQACLHMAASSCVSFQECDLKRARVTFHLPI